jgi:hypothetical protein
MDDDRLVFHFTDNLLFKTFIDAIPHSSLIEPLRKNQKLRDRYFKGYHLTADSPDRAVLIKCYQEEILKNHNLLLRNHLCAAWLSVRNDLTITGIKSVGVEKTEDLSWLSLIHETLEKEGHLAVVKNSC